MCNYANIILRTNRHPFLVHKKLPSVYVDKMARGLWRQTVATGLIFDNWRILYGLGFISRTLQLGKKYSYFVNGMPQVQISEGKPAIIITVFVFSVGILGHEHFFPQSVQFMRNSL
jgi:hypothetical protein